MREIALGGPRAKRHGIALVDDADFALVNQYQWCVSVAHSGNVTYAIRALKRDGAKTTQLMHRLIAGPGLVDHIDRNGLNNQRANLRPATYAQNAGNRTGVSGTSSKFKGVCWIKQSQKWRASICVSGRTLYLGEYATEQEAALAYDSAAPVHFGEFARLNLPEMS